MVTEQTRAHYEAMAAEAAAQTQRVELPTLNQIRRMSDRALVAYADATGDEWALDEIAERGCEHQFDDAYVASLAGGASHG